MKTSTGWCIKIISWFVIYVSIASAFYPSTPFWAYFIICFLCVVASGIVDHFVKKDEPGDEDDKEGNDQEQNS